MSDQPLLFRNFERINKRIIPVSSGVTYCNYMGMVDVVCKDGSKRTLANVLYIPGCGVTLLSGRRICAAVLMGQFTKSHMYLKCRTNKIITATIQGGLYVITHIKHRYQNDTFFGQGYDDIAFAGETINGTKGIPNSLTSSAKEI
jgi:hypothetical protein